MDSHRGRKLVVAYPGDFIQQTAFGTGLATADIDTRHPQSTPVFPGQTVTREQIRDCSGEYVIREDITSILKRLTFSFDADAKLIYGWIAYAMGLAAAATGTQAAEVWTITITGTPTAGALVVSHTNEGLTDSVSIPYDSTAAEIQAKFEELRTIKPGNVTVTGTMLAGPVVVTGAGKLAAGNVAQPTVDDSGLTDATAAIATTTAGTNQSAIVTRTTLDQTPLFSLIVGFEGDSTDPDKYKDVVVDTVTIRGALRGKVTVELTLIGSADLEAIASYVMPECVDIEPIYTKDCRLVIDGTFITEEVREFTYTFSNNIFTGDDPFPYDDIHPVRLEHGDRTSSFAFSIYGSKGDTVYTIADEEQTVPVRLLIGPPVERVEIDAPKTKMRLDDTPITFAGEAGRSAIGINATPHYDKNTTGTPDRAIYYGPLATQMLQT